MTSDLIAKEDDITATIAGLSSSYQPLDSDLTAIAALTTTSFGRGLLTDANAAALRTSAGLGGAAVLNVGTTTGTVAAGDDSRFGSGAPTGSTGGDLAGSTYPNPTIAAGAVTLAKQANLAANSFQGNNTGSAATPLALTVAQAKTLLALVKGDVGLGNVDNTADTSKPVSTAQQTALNLKANIASPTFTGTVTIPTGASITAPTGLVKGDVGLGNVDNTADATKNAATVTLTNHALSDTTTTVVNVADATKVVKFDLSGATTGKTATFAVPVTLARTITFPDATDTLVGKATTDTLTNKSIDAAQLTGTVANGRLSTGTGSANVVLGGTITGAGPTGDAAHTLALTYNTAGQLTAVTNNAIAIAGSQITSGTVPIGQLPTGTGASNVPVGGVITAAGPQGDAAHTQVVTFNAAGQLTTVTNTSIAIAASQVTSGLAGTYALLASPAFTGTVTAAAITSSNIVTAVVFAAGGGFGGLDFVATEPNYGVTSSTASLDTRTSRAGGPTQSGDVIGAWHVGAGTDSAGTSTAPGALVDCAQIFCRATQNFTGSVSGTAWDVYTTANGGNVKAVAATFDQDGSLIVTNNVAAGGAVSGTAGTFTSAGSFGGTLTAVGALTVRNFAGAENTFFTRANGASGTESKVLSTQTLAAINFQGWNDTNGGYLTGASITGVAEQDFTTTGFRGTGLRFNTAPSSTNGGALVRLILDNAGKLWWGATTGGATAFVDQSGNASFNGTLLAGGNIGFNGKTAQATTGWSAATATALRTAAPNATYSTTGGTGATAGAFDTAAHRDNVITDLANTMRRLGTLIADLTANGVIG